MYTSRFLQRSASIVLLSVGLLAGCSLFGGSAPSGNVRQATPISAPTAIVPTATPDPNQPFTGPASFTDAMTSDSGRWAQGKSVPANCFTANDGYHMVGYSPYQADCALLHGQWSNFAMQVQMTFIKVHQGCVAGFKFRATGSANGYNAYSINYYELGLRNDGLYGLSLFKNQKYVREVFHGVTTSFHQGANQTNLIGLVANGQKFSLYLNGQLINSGTDATWAGGAFAMQTVPTYQDEVVFANFQEWNF